MEEPLRNLFMKKKDEKDVTKKKKKDENDEAIHGELAGVHDHQQR